MEKQTEIKKTICMWCHSHCKVGIEVSDGQLLKMEADKDHPGGERLARVVRACSRARNAAEWFHHPDRLNYPLKRVGERGEGKWQTISWDQALDEIAAKLKDIKEKYGAEAVASSSGTGRTHDEYRKRFLNLFGSPNHVGQGYICFGPSNAASGLVCGGSTYSPSRSITKCIILWGTNPEQALRRYWFDILDRKREGAKLIVIDPREIAPARQADIWLQVRPGTDCALAMSMINVIIEEGLYDKEFVDKWCYGFDKLAERARQYPPEKVADITWIPAERIREVARIYATSKPAVINSQMGLEHLPNCMEALHARFILPAITGNLDIRGGELIRRRHPLFIGDYEVELNDKVSPEHKNKQIGADRFKLLSYPGYDLLIESAKKVKSEYSAAHNCFAHAPSVYEAMITGKPYPVRAMITLSSCPLTTQANIKHVYKALKSLDLYVVMDYWLTPAAEIADYVLPAASWLERPYVWTWWDTSEVVEVGEAPLPHQVEGKYDRRRDYDFWRSLGLRLGQGDYWPHETLEEEYDYRLKPLGYTLKEYMEKGGVERPPFEQKRYEKTGFATPTGKVELYSTILEKLGYDPLPRYYEPKESPVSTPELTKEYPFILITGGRHWPYFHSEHRQIDSLRKEHPDPLVQINPETAFELGIDDGDWVWIESPRGRIRQRCRHFSGINPKVIHAEHGWWFPELPGEEPWLHGVWESNANVLTSDDPDHCNPINGGWPLRTLVCKVYKAKKY